MIRAATCILVFIVVRIHGQVWEYGQTTNAVNQSQHMSSRFGSTEYNAQGDSGSSSDIKDRDSMLLSNYAIITATIESVGVVDKYGRSLVLNFDDVEVLEGVLAQRQDDETKMKVFGWSHWYERDDDGHLIPFDEDSGITVDDLGRTVVTEAGNDKFKHTIEEGVLEGVDEPAEIGDRDLWLGNSKKARTMAKVLSEHGHDVVDEDNKQDDNEWLVAEDEDEFSLREELQGRRIMFWFEPVRIEPSENNDLDQAIEFTDSVILDAETEAGITIKNADDDSGLDSSGNDEDDEEDEAEPEPEPEPETDEDEDFHEEVESVISSVSRMNNVSKENVEAMVDPAENDKLPDDYEPDVDAIYAEIQNRM